MDAVRPSTQLPTQGQSTSQSFIRSHYNQNADGNWTLDTTFLDKTLEGEGLVCSSVNSRGDCGYEAIVKAGKYQGDFRTLKTKTLAFVRSNNTAIRLQFQNAGGVTQNMENVMTQIQQSLLTDGEYANQNTLQLIAWMLNRNIVIHDIFDFHKINLIGRSPWSIDTTASTEPQIHIAYRRHQVFSLYDAEYKALGKLEGNYSISDHHHIINLRSPSQPALPNQNYFQPLANDDDLSTLGNGR
jgi:hypothetical protein